jgi:hypothetical protein
MIISIIADTTQFQISQKIDIPRDNGECKVVPVLI